MVCFNLLLADFVEQATPDRAASIPRFRQLLDTSTSNSSITKAPRINFAELHFLGNLRVSELTRETLELTRRVVLVALGCL